MALANVADRLAREGFRVLMIDFDLEAPGLEKYFAISQASVRSHLGLLDLLLGYKRSMSIGAGEERDVQTFRQLWKHFILPVYDHLPGEGRLDLLPAGQRDGGQEIAQYALNLRTFDWQDFYFNWEGELFFEWLRRALLKGQGADPGNPKPYDVVLVDSRTGVTEMGGICTYQLADAILMFCAANQQSVEGTREMACDFLSPRVRQLRRERPLQLVVVPARVEQQDEGLLEKFRAAFESEFSSFLPHPFAAASLSFWDLMIPYDAHYAFEERVTSRPSRKDQRVGLGNAFQKLTQAIALLAPRGTNLSTLTAGQQEESLSAKRPKLQPAASPQYEPTWRFAGWDAYLSYTHSTDMPYVVELARLLRDEGRLQVFRDEESLLPGDKWAGKIEESIRHSRNFLFCIGQSGIGGPWQKKELRLAIEATTSAGGLRIIPVLLPGVDQDLIPESLRSYEWADFRQGVEDSKTLRRLIRAIRDVPAGETPQSSIDYGPPYRGLQPFNEEDAGVFFGREKVVAKLVKALETSNFLAVAGRSGCGKTSLVRAGLFPELRRGALPNSELWSLRTFRPGIHPLAQLASTLDAEPTREEIQKNGRWRRLLFVDQFEETFTLCPDEKERQQFVDRLVDIARQAEGPASILLGFRSDFFDRCEGYPGLVPLLQDYLFLVPPLSSEELRYAIEKPAQRVGLAFEPGLVDRISRDVEKQPGALPLLQFLLFHLWERRRDGWLTNNAYDEIGGVQGALTSSAEAVLQAMTPDQQQAARKVFLRLIQPGDTAGDTRRRAALTELIDGKSSEVIEAVVNKLIAARLLIADRDPSGVTFLELAHESLIRNWPRLRDWADEDREFLRWRYRLQLGLRTWSDNKRDPAGLLAGTALAKAEYWLKERHNDISAEELEYVISSLQRRDLRLRRQRRVTRNQWIAGGATLSVIAALAFLSAYLFSTTTEAENAQNRAAQVAEFYKQILSGVAKMRSPDGRWLFIQDNDGASTVLDTRRSRGARWARTSSVRVATFSPDSRLLAIGHEDGSVMLWGLEENRSLERFQARERVNKLDFDSTTKFLAVASDDPTVTVWDVTARKTAWLLKGQQGPVIDVQFSSNGKKIRSVGKDGMTCLSELSEPTRGTSVLGACRSRYPL
jgi:hypothetical protein